MDEADVDKQMAESIATAVPVSGESDSSAVPAEVVAQPVPAEASNGTSLPAPSGDEPAAASGSLDTQEVGFIAVAFCSLMVMIQASHACDESREEYVEGLGCLTYAKYTADNDDCSDELGFAVSVAVISLVILAVHFLIFFIKPLQEPAKPWTTYVEPFLVLIMWILWAIATIVLTFPQHKEKKKGKGPPFELMGTGWLMTWAALSVCTGLLYPELAPAWQWLTEKCPMCTKVGAPDGHSFVFLLGSAMAAFIAFCAAADICEQRDDADLDCDDEYGWAVSNTIVSFIAPLVLILLGKCMASCNPIVIQIISVALCVWTWLGVVVCCVDKPFQGGFPANGFWGMWLAFVLACLNAFDHFGVFGNVLGNEKEGEGL